MIVEVVVDGEAWSGEKLNSPQHAAFNAREIKFASANPAHLVAQTFQDASEALRTVDLLQQDAAQLLQSDQTAPALERLGEAISIWMSVQQALTMGLQLVQIDPASVRGKDASPLSLDDMIGELNAHLRQMHASLQGGDSVALADALMYEMPPVVLQWRELLDSLRAQLAGQRKDV